jgi:hypothetical protein
MFHIASLPPIICRRWILQKIHLDTNYLPRTVYFFGCKVKFRFEVLFKNFHSRINLTKLFLNKTYLVNRIKLFPGNETRSLGTLRYLNFKILSIQGIKLAKKIWELHFPFSRSYGLGFSRFRSRNFFDINLIFEYIQKGLKREIPQKKRFSRHETSICAKKCRCYVICHS